VGIRLIVEVLDHWQDAGLTPGERWDLLVLAENANDGTRLTYGPVHAQHILERANKSPKGWKNAITALMRKKVITTHVPGRIKQVAVYHLEHLCPEPPHDGYKGHCTRPSKDQEEGHPASDPLKEEGHPADDPMGHPTDDPLGQEGHPADAERVIQQVTPTPPNSSSKETPLTTPSSSVAEVSVSATETTEGGGGGREIPSEDQDQTQTRAQAFVSQLDYRGRDVDKQQRQRLCALVADALAAGWSEGGLNRYLDISDDPNVRNAASLYLYKLHADRLPDARPTEAVTQGLPPACSQCLSWDPGAATDASLRVDRMSFSGGLCPRCHPAAVQSDLPACAACLEWNSGAATNPSLRHRPDADGNLRPCDECNPGRVAFLARQQDSPWGTVAPVLKSRQQQETDAWADRAMARAQQRAASGNWKGAGTDERVAGWAAIAASLRADAQHKQGGHQPYRNPTDQSVYDEDFGPGPAVDPGGYDEPL
jgi:hypothetical protein